MKLSRKWIIVAALVLSVAMASSGTIAYLQDSDSNVNVMTMGSVHIKQHEYERVVENGEYKTATIDDKTSYVLKDFTQGKPIVPIVGDPSLPGDNPGYAGYDTTPVRMSQVDSYGGMDVFAGKNAQDKFVTVENTGKSPAYVRTLVAIEIGSTDGGKIGCSYHQTWTKNTIGAIVIDGNNYTLTEYLYNGAAGVRHEKGILPAGDTTYPNLSQVYLKAAATNEDLEAIDGNGNGMLDILVVSQAVQADGFADAATALNTAFGEVSATSHPWIETNFENADNDTAFENAVTGDQKEIVVTLTDDVTYDVAAWAANGMGSENTENIIINGNGHTITFYQTNSDWNNIVTNGAKLTIMNAHITNAGHNDGPWNRHDLNFACEVEMNNVTSDKAIALKAGAKLTNVTISDANASDTYAIWVQPKGQTVTLDNCTIDMLDCTDGRGLKIDNQYVAAADEGKVTLVVKNTTFKTEEKSAILVKSTKGAYITLENVDISGVEADNTNAVWVDEATSSYADLVTVTGGNKIVEH